MLTETTVTTYTVACDGPSYGTTCPTPSIVTNTEAALLPAMRKQGWMLPDVDKDGKIDRNSICYCRACLKNLQAAGKL